MMRVTPVGGGGDAGGGVDDGGEPPMFPKFEANVALTSLFFIIDTSHVSVPEHPPPNQLVNVLPASGAAERVIVGLPEYVSEQSVPQLIPVPVTVPAPIPPLRTERRVFPSGVDGGIEGGGDPATI